MRRLVSVALPLALLFLSALPTQAQEHPAELQRLDYLVGTWEFSYEGAPGTWKCAWFGETFVQCNAETTDASGNRIATVDLIAYDVATGTFPWYRFLFNGVPEEATGRIHDNTWTFVFDETHQGTRRVLLLADSPTALRFRWEDVGEDGGWTLTSEFPMAKVR